MRKPTSFPVFVGDFGETRITPECLAAYGLQNFPIDRRSSRQRNNLKKLQANIAVMQEHYFRMGNMLDEV